MDDDSIDECFLSETVSPKSWWEARRLSYNKVCLVVGIIILIISTVIILSNLENDMFMRDDVRDMWLFGLFYFIVRNIAYTFIWIIESLFNTHFSETGRHNFFVIFIILTLLFPVAAFILLLIIVQ